jgi:hypothetical protein
MSTNQKHLEMLSEQAKLYDHCQSMTSTFAGQQDMASANWLYDTGFGYWAGLRDCDKASFHPHRTNSCSTSGEEKVWLNVNDKKPVTIL